MISRLDQQFFPNRRLDASSHRQQRLDLLPRVDIPLVNAGTPPFLILPGFPVSDNGGPKRIGRALNRSRRVDRAPILTKEHAIMVRHLHEAYIRDTTCWDLSAIAMEKFTYGKLQVIAQTRDVVASHKDISRFNTTTVTAPGLTRESQSFIKEVAQSNPPDMQQAFPE